MVLEAEHLSHWFVTLSFGKFAIIWFSMGRLFCSSMGPAVSSPAEPSMISPYEQESRNVKKKSENRKVIGEQNGFSAAAYGK